MLNQHQRGSRGCICPCDRPWCFGVFAGSSDCGCSAPSEFSQHWDLHPLAQLEKHRSGHSRAIINPCVKHCKHHLILIQSQMFVQKQRGPKCLGDGAIDKGLLLPKGWMDPDTWDCLSRLACPALCKLVCVRVWGHLVTDLRQECMRS